MIFHSGGHFSMAGEYGTLTIVIALKKRPIYEVKHKKVFIYFRFFQAGNQGRHQSNPQI